MKSELIIKSNDNHIDFAILRDGKLTELYREDSDKKISVGDIFLAKTGKVLPGLNAAFVNVGAEKDGFLHYHDLGPQFLTTRKYLKHLRSAKKIDYLLKNFTFEPDIDKNGSISNLIKNGNIIPVQIVKESISSKGPRLSAELSLAGRYMVLLPFSDRVSVSQKIKSKEERQRLIRLVRSIKPKGFGIILRTVAQGKKVAEINRDMERLLERWKKLSETLSKTRVGKNPVKVFSELSRSLSILRDVLNDTFVGIHVDNKSLYEEVKEFVSDIAPGQTSIVKLYKGDIPIFQKFGVDRQIKTSFGKTVSMPSGAYLVIEHTEALHVIDVNSGNRSNKAKTQQETALEVNLMAATEIARQLQLRDMGGIIVIDFIDMRSADNRKKLYEHFKEEMSKSRTKHKVLPLSRFGLMQVTRQRVREETEIKTTEANPNKNGEVEAPILLIDEIQRELEKHLSKNIYKDIFIHVHPFVAAYLTKGGFFKSILWKWRRTYKKRIKIIERDYFQYLKYHFELRKK